MPYIICPFDSMFSRTLTRSCPTPALRIAALHAAANIAGVCACIFCSRKCVCMAVYAFMCDTKPLWCKNKVHVRVCAMLL